MSRIRPLTALATAPAMRFLFVTTTQLADTISALAVDTSRFEPRDVSLNVEKAWDPVPTEARRRIGVLEALNLEIVASRIADLLRQHFKVPSSRRQACTKALVDRVREGLLHQHRAVRRIAGAGKIAFAHSPVELASFRALVAGPQKKATPKKEPAPKALAPKAPEAPPGADAPLLATG